MTRRSLSLLTVACAAVSSLGACAPPLSSPMASVAPSPPVTNGARAWSAKRRDARDACHAKDLLACETRLLDLYAFSGSARLLLEIASVEARLGERVVALEHLHTYAATGLTADLRHDPGLAPLASTPEGLAIDASLRANRSPIAHARQAFALPHDDLVTEGVAWDAATHTFLVSSVRKRKILSIDEHGAARDFVPQAADGAGAMCGIASAGDSLWVAMATMPPMIGFEPAGEHPQALLHFDLKSGSLREKIALRTDPTDHRARALTDLAVGPNGDAYVSDALGGGVYVLARDTHALVPLAFEDAFVSPQTPTPTADGKRIFVPDYVRGIASVDPATHAVTWLPHPKEIAVEGIDDLHIVGSSLVAIQNGTSPVRVIRFDMDPALSRIESFTVLEQETPGLGEPTHGVVVDGVFFFLANAGWDRFNAEGALAADAKPDEPVMMRLPLP